MKSLKAHNERQNSITELTESFETFFANSRISIKWEVMGKDAWGVPSYIIKRCVFLDSNRSTAVQVIFLFTMSDLIKSYDALPIWPSLCCQD